ncbi:hypothetical protein [Streptomyces sp. NPDC001435]|uniref:hypothetical protein n=1 Tax=unclassified Streptomyces TaxID=2593676 RepID=UPI0036AC444F
MTDGALLREKIGMDRIRAGHAGATIRLSRDHGHLALLAGSYSYILEFAPKVLEAVRFAGGTDAKPPTEALGILRELNATGARNVPDGAPTVFVPSRWQGYLDEAAARGDATAYRHYWELCTLLALRDGPAQRGRVCTGLTALRQPGRLPVHPRPVGDAPRGVLPSGRQEPRRLGGAAAGRSG